MIWLDRFKRGWAALILFAMLFAMPYLAVALGWIEGVSSGAWLTIFLAFVVGGLKIGLSKQTSKQFRIDRHGNDLCLLAVTGCFTLFTLQAANDADVMPGARRTLAMLGFSDLSGGPVAQNIVAAVVFGIIAVGLFVATAFMVQMVRETEENTALPVAKRKAPVLAGLCYFTGVLSASFYALSLTVK